MAADQKKTDPFILMVDDEVEVLQGLQLVLQLHGFANTHTCCDPNSVPALLAGQDVACLLLDLLMPARSGESVLDFVSREHPDVPVIVVTGVNDVDTAVRCMRKGAADYLIKPVEDIRLVASVTRAIEFWEMWKENEVLRSCANARTLRHPEAFQDLVAVSDGMRQLCRYMEMVAMTSQPVLITGETGVGKELVARAIHRLSKRTGEFVAVNVAGLDDAAFADTLFGHRKGAFTGAVEARGGLVEKADGGTLLLDEIGDLEVKSQIKLLRLLQEREYMTLGSDEVKKTDARILCATNRDLDAACAAGKFRKDLHFRLRHHHVHVPPLRERLEGDLPVLAGLFVAEAAAEVGRPAPAMPSDFLALLRTYRFPGNIRELKAMIHDAVSTSTGDVLQVRAMRERMARGSAWSQVGLPQDAALTFHERLPTLKAAAELLIAEAMERAGGNQRIAAGLLGITQQALSQRLKKTQ